MDKENKIILYKDENGRVSAKCECWGVTSTKLSCN